MIALYKGQEAKVTECMGAPEGSRTGDVIWDMDGAVLDEELWVSFADPDLIVDPTDDQVAAARAGQPIPSDPEREQEVFDLAVSFLDDLEVNR